MCSLAHQTFFGITVTQHQMCQVNDLYKSIFLNNFPVGMSNDVRWILKEEGCLAEKLCKIFGYRFERKNGKCCSKCDDHQGVNLAR